MDNSNILPGGWIKLYRKSLDHWLYKTKKPKTRREAWEDILLLVNYKSEKTLIKGHVYDCGKGQSLLSLDSWAKQFNWSKQQVRTFFTLLQKDGMITLEGSQFTTRLTVCNYELYQQIITRKGNEVDENDPLLKHAENTDNELNEYNEQHASNTQATRNPLKNQHTKDTGNEINNTIEQHTENTQPVKKVTPIEEYKNKEIRKEDFPGLILKKFQEKHGHYTIVNDTKDNNAVKKIAAIILAKYPAFSLEKSLEIIDEYFNECIHIKDKWYRNNMSPSLIACKFNEINNILCESIQKDSIITDFIGFNNHLEYLSHSDMVKKSQEFGPKIWDQYQSVTLPGWQKPVWVNKKDLERIEKP